MSNLSNTNKSELKAKIEDIVVDTSLHPVEATLRILALFDQAVEEAEDEIFKQILGTSGEIVFNDFVGEKGSTLMQVVKVKDVAEQWEFIKNYHKRKKSQLSNKGASNG